MQFVVKMGSIFTVSGAIAEVDGSGIGDRTSSTRYPSTHVLNTVRHVYTWWDS